MHVLNFMLTIQISCLLSVNDNIENRRMEMSSLKYKRLSNERNVISLFYFHKKWTLLLMNFSVAMIYQYLKQDKG